MANRTERELLMSLLFGGDTTLINLRCFRRHGDGIANEPKTTSEEIAAQIRSALKQKEDGTATVSTSFQDDATKIDVRAVVASLTK
jgi:hypothetical protein